MDGESMIPNKVIIFFIFAIPLSMWSLWSQISSAHNEKFYSYDVDDSYKIRTGLRFNSSVHCEDINGNDFSPYIVLDFENEHYSYKLECENGVFSERAWVVSHTSQKTINPNIIGNKGCKDIYGHTYMENQVVRETYDYTCTKFEDEYIWVIN